MKATLDQAEEIVETLIEMYEELPQKDKDRVYMDVSYLYNSVVSMIDQPNCVIVYKDGGVLLGWLGINPLYPIIEVQEQLFYVPKDKRSTGLSKDLHAMYIEYAKAHGAMYSLVAHSTGTNPEAARKCYLNLGYSETGSVYEKEL